jgi:hypothetical protein
VPDEYDYTDLTTLASTGKVACLLCQRQFKTEEILRKHTAQSDLHKARSSPFDFQALNHHIKQWVVKAFVDVKTDIVYFTLRMHPIDCHPIYFSRLTL